MGNPTGVVKKKREKRRKKFEARFHGLAYVPKELREQVLAEIAKQDAAEAKKS
jgi:hypothetical protein